MKKITGVHKVTKPLYKRAYFWLLILILIIILIAGSFFLEKQGNKNQSINQASSKKINSSKINNKSNKTKEGTNFQQGNKNQPLSTSNSSSSSSSAMPSTNENYFTQADFNSLNDDPSNPPVGKGTGYSYIVSLIGQPASENFSSDGKTSNNLLMATWNTGNNTVSGGHQVTLTFQDSSGGVNDRNHMYLVNRSVK